MPELDLKDIKMNCPYCHTPLKVLKHLVIQEKGNIILTVTHCPRGQTTFYIVQKDEMGNKP